MSERGLMVDGVPVLVLGSTGRIGRVLRHVWHRMPQGKTVPIWQSRERGAGLFHWDILSGPCPGLPQGGVVLCLAGVTRGTVDQLEANTTIAMAACRAAEAYGARHVFLASSAAVYGPSAEALTEDMALAPLGAYGKAKARMERAGLAWAKGAKPGLTLLRIGNVAGLDALLGGLRQDRPAVLDPVSGQAGGPRRSYIGPVSLARLLFRLAEMAAAGSPLPQVLNIAAAPPVSMASLLDAAGAPWRYGPENPDVLPCVALSTARLRAILPDHVPAADPAALVAEWREVAACL